MRSVIQTPVVLLMVTPFVLTIMSCSASSSSIVQWDTGQPSDPICTALLGQFEESEFSVNLQYIEYSKVAETPDWYIARVDWERDWWGDLEVFRWDGSEIVDRMITSPADFEITGQSISRIGTLSHQDHEAPIVYAIDRTHQGNRMLYLWLLDPDTGLAPLCKARLSLNSEGNEYDLEWSFIDHDSDGYSDLVLEGEMLSTGEGLEDMEPDVIPVRKVFLFDPDTHMYLLNREESIGVSSWDFMDSGFTDEQAM